MKLSTFLRPLLALTLAASLAACGGGTKSYVLGGTVSGLTDPGLVLANGSTTLTLAPVTVVNNDGSTSTAAAFNFAFPDKLAYGSVFNVTVQTNPAHQSCGTSANAGSAGTTASNAIIVICTRNSYTVGGTVTGLSTTGLVLTNGSDTLTVASAAAGFTFAGRVNDSAAYGVTILTQPVGQTCVVSSGSGVVNGANVNSVAVTCR